MLREARVAAILPAADIERAKKFYSETLNLPQADVPTVGNDVAFQCGQGTLLYVYEREAGTKADHTVAGWLVEDVEEAVEKLAERGVEFEQYDLPGLRTDERGIAELDGAKSAWFKDPEGNILAINQLGA